MGRNWESCLRISWDVPTIAVGPGSFMSYFFSMSRDWHFSSYRNYSKAEKTRKFYSGPSMRRTSPWYLNLANIVWILHMKVEAIILQKISRNRIQFLKRLVLHIPRRQRWCDMKKSTRFHEAQAALSFFTFSEVTMHLPVGSIL